MPNTTYSQTALFFSGNSNWNWPVNITSVLAEMLGGGGYSGRATGRPATGGGGKGGSYARKTITKGAETFLAVSIGAGGVPQPSPVSAQPSTVTQNSVIVCSAAGGGGGFDGVSNDENGAGGTFLHGSNIGDVVFVGGNGGRGTYAGVDKSGAGGGSAGPTGNGGAGGNQTGVAGVAGTGYWINSSAYQQDGATGVGEGGDGQPPSVYGVGGGVGAGGGAAGANAAQFQGGPSGFGASGRAGIGLFVWWLPPIVSEQTTFRWYLNDSTTSNNATPIAAQDENGIVESVGPNQRRLLRFRFQETSGIGQGHPTGEGSEAFQLFVSKNGGPYIYVNSTTHTVGFSPTGMVGALTNILGTGSGTYRNGVAGGAQLNYNFPGPGGYTELLYGVEFVTAQLISGDTFDFRMYINGMPFDSYVITPRMTVYTSDPKLFGTNQAIPRASFY